MTWDDELEELARKAYHATAEEMDGWPFDSASDAYKQGFIEGYQSRAEQG